MAYTNVWSTTLPNGSEASSSIASLIDSVRIDVGDRLADIFGIPDMTADPIRPTTIKFTDAGNGAINLGDNAGTPRSLNINNKANSQTYITLNSTAAVFGVPLQLIGGAFQLVIGGNTTGQIQIKNDNNTQAYVIGNDGTLHGTSFIIQDNTAGVTRLTLASSGLFTLTAGLTVSAGTTALQATTVTSLTASSNIILGTNNIALQGKTTGGSTVNLFVLTNDGNSITRFVSGVDAGAFQWTNQAQTVQWMFLQSSGLIVNSGLTVSAGTAAVQALTATTIAATNIISSTVTAAALVANGVSTSARWVEVSNTSGQAIFGVESSVGGTLVTGATGYDTVVRGNSGICFSANGGTLHGRMSSAGLLTLNNGLTVSSGSTSLQALTTTTINASSQITGTNIFAGTGNVFQWNGRSALWSDIDGNIRLTNAAATGFSLLQFGGTSNLFPALRRTTTTLDVMLADASAFTQLHVGTLLTESTITITAGGIIVSSGTSALQAVTATTVSLSSTLTLGTANYLQGSSTSVGIAATTIYTHSGGGVDHIIVTGVDGSGNNFCDLIAFDGTNFARNVINNLAAPATRAYTVAASALKLAMSAGTYTVKTAPLQVT